MGKPLSHQQVEFPSDIIHKICASALAANLVPVLRKIQACNRGYYDIATPYIYHTLTIRSNKQFRSILHQLALPKSSISSEVAWRTAKEKSSGDDDSSSDGFDDTEEWERVDDWDEWNDLEITKGKRDRTGNTASKTPWAPIRSIHQVEHHIKQLTFLKAPSAENLQLVQKFHQYYGRYRPSLFPSVQVVRMDLSVLLAYVDIGVMNCPMSSDRSAMYRRRENIGNEMISYLINSQKLAMIAKPHTFITSSSHGHSCSLGDKLDEISEMDDLAGAFLVSLLMVWSSIKRFVFLNAHIKGLKHSPTLHVEIHFIDCGCPVPNKPFDQEFAWLYKYRTPLLTAQTYTICSELSRHIDKEEERSKEDKSQRIGRIDPEAPTIKDTGWSVYFDRQIDPLDVEVFEELVAGYIAAKYPDQKIFAYRSTDPSTLECLTVGNASVITNV